eukprot:1061967-Pyramimonas_sp.AAC.2
MAAAAGLSLSDVIVDSVTASSVAVATTTTFGPAATASPSAFASAMLTQSGSIFSSAAFSAYGDAQVAGLQTSLSWPTLAPTVRVLLRTPHAITPLINKTFSRSRSALPSNFHGRQEERAGDENCLLSPRSERERRACFAGNAGFARSAA